jgi:hypothetical protein
MPAAAQPPGANGTLPGNGLAQHPFLYRGQWQQRGHSDQTV